MNLSRGFGAVLAVILVAVTTAVVWWVLAGAPGVASPPAGQGEGSTPAANPDFMVSPTSGQAPLSVSFAVKRDLGTVHIISYGDGTSGTVTDFICGLKYCTKTHAYSRPGTYTASYEDASGTVLRSFTITVTQSW